ncbi:MAG: DUF4832 domain-containing protein [Vicinamibacterales bacterium]
MTHAPLSFVLAATAALWISGRTTPAGQTVSSSTIDSQVVTYSSSDENFPNPERGFYRQALAFDLGTGRNPLGFRTFSDMRRDGMSLIRVYYVIDEFREGPLSRAALDEIAADLNEVRQAGVKIIPRFAYSFPCAGPDPCTAGRIAAEAIDPPLSRVLEHIDQLTPLLRSGSDVIAFMEMGFVGAWGEWHHSSTELVSSDRTVNSRSAAIVERVLFGLSEKRMAVLRYPYHKQSFFGAKPLDDTEAFNGSVRARIGAHNDCFLASPDDTGTYLPPNLGPLEKNIQALKKYLNLDNRFVPQGGETCSAEPAAQPFIGCANALNDLALLRWSALNIQFQPRALDLWRQQGCFLEIQRRLGYRFRLIETELPDHATAGLWLTIRFVLINDGWASPFNPRAVELILRHAVSGRSHVIPVAADPRRWGPGEAYRIEVREIVPAGLEPGLYDVLLNLPDPEARLRGRPEYSIRLANDDIWESSTGYNRLQGRVLLTP